MSKGLGSHNVSKDDALDNLKSFNVSQGLGPHK